MAAVAGVDEGLISIAIASFSSRSSTSGRISVAILITGGTGFLGSYLTRHLVREKGIAGKDLILFDRYPNRERIADVADQVTLVTGDITEPTELAAAIKNYNVEQVYHLAAILGDPTPTQVVSYM